MSKQEKEMLELSFLLLLKDLTNICFSVKMHRNNHVNMLNIIVLNLVYTILRSLTYFEGTIFISKIVTVHAHLCKTYSLCYYIIRIIKSRRMRWAGHVA
jgi:hypothetical protein